jgi:hypothetical protein
MQFLSTFLDVIRDTVNSPESADMETVGQAVAEYADECRKANQRLRQVDKLLRDGLRSEAIQQAEMEPALLTLVADLDLPFLEEWEGMLAQWGLPLPPKLDLEIAQRLNVAYAELRPLEQLLRQHRLLALARAPLNARIEVLRKITALDELNFSWQSDLTEYERVRIRQIRAEVNEAIKSRDVRVVKQLCSELSYAHWTCEVPGELRQEAEAAFRSLQMDSAREELTLLAPQLIKAHSELDVAQAEGYASDWRRLADIAKLASDDVLSIQVKETLTWLEAELKDRSTKSTFDSLLASLETALEQESSQKQIESLLHKLERFSLPIPEKLIKRAQSRIDYQAAHSRRRSTLFGVIAVVGLLIISVALFGYWRIQHQQHLLVEHRAKLESLVSSGSWDQGEKYIKALSDVDRQDPHLASLGTKIQEALQSEQNRVSKLESLFEGAESESIESLDRQLLGSIKKLIKTSEEQQRFDDLDLKLGQHEQRLQESRDKAYLAELKAWSEKLSVLEKQGNKDDQSLWSVLNKLESDLAQHDRISPGLSQRGAIVTNKLHAIIKQEENEKHERSLIEDVFQAVGQPVEFTQRLQQVIAKQPESQAAAHARRVLDEQAAWSSLVEWNKFWSSYPSSRPFTPAQAEEILEAGKMLKSRTLGNELSEAYERRVPYLEAILGRDNMSLLELKQILCTNNLVSNLWVVEDENQDRYYCLEKPTIEDTRIRFKYLVDSQNTVKPKSFLSNANKFRTYRAPQSESAEFFLKLFKDLNSSNWEKSFYQLATHIRTQLTQDPGLDPVLGLDQLRRILQLGCDGSLAFKSGFEEVLEEIDGSGVDLSVSWYLPNDDEATSTRRDARIVLDALPNFQDCAKAASSDYHEFCFSPRKEIRWVGALNRLGTDGWQCRPPLSTDTNGTLFVAKTAGTKKVSLSKVADVKSGKIEWAPSAAEQPIASPLFLETDNPANTGTK